MGYWLKRFADGTEFRGTDVAVSVGTASWRRSKSENMVGAELEHHGFILEIFGGGEYWQSDTLESLFPGKSSLVKRRIEYRVNPSDKFYLLKSNSNELRVVVGGKSREGYSFHQIKKSEIGRWLILEYNIKTKRARYFWSENKI